MEIEYKVEAELRKHSHVQAVFDSVASESESELSSEFYEDLVDILPERVSIDDDICWWNDNPVFSLTLHGVDTQQVNDRNEDGLSYVAFYFDNNFVVYKVTTDSIV